MSKLERFGIIAWIIVAYISSVWAYEKDLIRQIKKDGIIHPLFHRVKIKCEIITNVQPTTHLSP